MKNYPFDRFLLVVDDDVYIRAFVRNILVQNGFEVDEASNGSNGIESVRKNPDKYSVALLDINMPGLSGLEVLPELLKYGRDLAVVMISGDAELDQAVEAMKIGAYDFLQKPFGADVLASRIEKTMELRTLRKEHKLYVQDIENKVAERTSQLEEARKATIFALARLAEYRDEETGFHLERMAEYVVVLAQSLKDMGLYRDILTSNYIDLLCESAPLHDIGKVGIPDGILLKPDHLTPEEYETIKTHTTIGARTIEDVQKKVQGYTFLSIGHELALNHHEHFDGNGYPNGLKANRIPLSARILTIADFYDALTFPRIYRQSIFPHPEVKVIIENEAGKKFAPDVVSAFSRCEQEFYSIHQRLED